MPTIAELSRQHIALTPSHILHLQHLIAEWELLADLYRSDLLLFVPADAAAQTFVVLAHIRPTNSETIYREDPVGRIYTRSELRWVSQAWRAGETMSGEIGDHVLGEPVLIEAIPVRRRGEVIAILTRDAPKVRARRQTPMDEPYAEAASMISSMIAEGTFPYRSASPVLTETIRAGDGFIQVDADLTIRYASPNAVSVMHRLGVEGHIEGGVLSEAVVNDAVVRAAVATSLPASDEVEAGDVSILMLSLPLLRKGKSTGALLLVRDISEIRRRDRLLLSKEAAIREIHHRVKNNLQTIASFLRLQARRVESVEATEALQESVRRIRSIALVHELLSRDTGGWLPFNSLLQPLVRDVVEGLVGERPIAFKVEGDAGLLPAESATPLAVVLTELLQNAVEHGFVDFDESEIGEGVVTVSLERSDDWLGVAIRDNGHGFPPNFSPENQRGLGLRIVTELVQTELSGSIEFGPNPDGAGTEIRLRVAVPFDPGARAEVAAM